MNEYSVEYRPLHRSVRSAEREIRELEEAIERDMQRLRRLSRAGLEEGEEAVAADAEIHAFETEAAALAARIPPEWQEARARFVELAGAEENARRQYRRSVDDAYEFIVELQGPDRLWRGARGAGGGNCSNCGGGRDRRPGCLE